MKWFTHQSLAAASAIALGMPWPAVAGALAGAVLPDVIDQRLARLTPNPQRTFNRIHRGASHWFGWYTALWLALLAAPELMPGLFASLKSAGLLHGMGSGAIRGGQAALLAALAGTAYGALTHVALDMLTPSGVPLTPFSRKRKLSLNLCPTGSLREYAFLAVSLGLLCLLAGDRMQETLRVLRRML